MRLGQIVLPTNVALPKAVPEPSFESGVPQSSSSGCPVICCGQQAATTVSDSKLEIERLSQEMATAPFDLNPTFDFDLAVDEKSDGFPWWLVAAGLGVAALILILSGDEDGRNEHRGR